MQNGRSRQRRFSNFRYTRVGGCSGGKLQWIERLLISGAAQWPKYSLTPIASLRLRRQLRAACQKLFGKPNNPLPAEEWHIIDRQRRSKFSASRERRPA